jgi:hypothetical protein
VLPLCIALLGPAGAMLHALLSLALAHAALDALFLWYRKLPFACGTCRSKTRRLCGQPPFGVW